MGRIYTAQFNGVAVTAAQDLFELVAPATGIIRIHELDISQTSDVGDAQEELLLLTMKSGATSAGSGGSTLAGVPREFLDSAFTGTILSSVMRKGQSTTHPLGSRFLSL